jgi:hypothetical protein
MIGKNTAATPKTKPPVRPPVEQNTAAKVKAFVTKVYCTLCTRTVEATVGITSTVIGSKRRWGVEPGQRCQHCGASLDAAYVLGNMS